MSIFNEILTKIDTLITEINKNSEDDLKVTEKACEIAASVCDFYNVLECIYFVFYY